LKFLLTIHLSSWWIKKGSVNIPGSRSAILNFNSAGRFLLLLRFPMFAALALLLAPSLLPGQTAGTGSIVGRITDPQGKALAGAKVDITNEAKSATIHVTASSAGWYSSGPIEPGEYEVRVEVKGFNAPPTALVVQVGTTSTGNVRMLAGTEAPKGEVAGGTTVNIEQAAVQGVLDGGLIESLPVSGRSFVDLAQLNPGIQVQDGGVLDPAKNGFSSIAFLSRFGRAERINVDGVDISDETVGGPSENISAGAIQEFQLSQSLLDLSTGLTSSGAVNVTTRSGSNQTHGEAFGAFRGNQGSAALPGVTAPSFQRELFGGHAGGAFIKDKVFWFADAERAKQDFTVAEPFTFPFNGLNATIAQPYRGFDTDERLDWSLRGSTRAFYRFNFSQNTDVRPYGSASSTQLLRSDDNTASHTLGVDFNTGAYAHSLRFGYLKLRSAVADATGGLGGADNPIPGLGINIGASTAGNCVVSNGGSYCGGPGWLGPQQLVQSNKEARYDGSRVMGKHIIRYGITFDRIEGARLAAHAAFPQVGTTSLDGLVSSDPTVYPADWVSLGNGIGSTTGHAAFGFPAGGLSADNRLEAYAGDSWKIKSKLTVTYGVHYVRDTARTDSGLGALPALNQWGPGYGGQINNPNLNFAPQAGFVWDVGGVGKTVVRGGAGLFYENSLWNNVLQDSPARLGTGIFADAPQVCSGGVANAFSWPTNPGLPGAPVAGGAGTVVTNPTTGAPRVLPNFCGGTISTVAPQILALSSAFQAASASVPRGQPNGAFVGTALTALNPNYDLLSPNYQTPRSWQMNLGFQKEITPRTVLSLDYVRNVGQHFLIGQDINHSGAARSFNQANAVAARDAAQVSNGCPTGSGQVTCMIHSTFATGAPLGVAGAQAAYSSVGLDSNLQSAGGGPCSYCAFPGTNAITGNSGAVGGVDMLFPVGRSVYSGVQMKLVQRIDKPVRYLKSANFQVAYSYSKYVSPVQDQDGVNVAVDNDNANRFKGPNGLDRKHQISFGGTFDLPFRTKLSAIGHFYSPLPQNLQLPELTNGGEIFATDWVGAGLGASSVSAPMPGTQTGQFERGINIGNLQSVINNYNHTYANQLTPAGECLVANSTASSNPLGGCPGLISGPEVMTPGDMNALGWALPTLASVAPGAVGIPWLKTLDLKASWPIKVKERVTIEPSASVFNVFNFANAFLPGNLPGASLAPGTGSLLAPNAIGGVTSGAGLTPFRASFQSGTYGLGAPRQFEFGLRISF
jgi:hypothetical protein